MQERELQFHIQCVPGQVGRYCILPGDPGRCEEIARYFDHPVHVQTNREYVTGTGTYKGVPITVCSTGIGAPSAEIALVELIEFGAKALIRIGGTGVLSPEIQCGDMVINTAAMRMGGASRFYAPEGYPAEASFEVTDCLIDACKQAGARYWKGISASTGSFFAGRTPPPCTPIVLRCNRKGKRSIPKKSGSKNNGAFLCKIPMDIRRIFWQNNALRAMLHSPPPFFRMVANATADTISCAL